MTIYHKLFVAAALAVGSVCADVKTDLNLQSGDVIAISGDSVTSAHMWSHYFGAWLQLSYPELDLMTYEAAQSGSNLVGWATASAPAPTASWYERFVYILGPDVIFLMLGQNGGQSASAHGDSYDDFTTNWGSDFTKLVMVGMHPVQAATDSKDAEGKADEEATKAALDANWFASHTYDQMGTAWLGNSSNTIDVQQTSATPFSGIDAVHPGPAGHIVIAWAVLQGLGAETVVSQATINAATQTEVSSVNCTLTNITGSDTNISFDRLDTRLPWAIDEIGRANAVALVPAIEEWQDYSITVTNLAAGTYTITCDGETLGTATHTELSAGWNMADLTDGPVWDQCQEVLGEFRDLQGNNRTTGVALASNANSGTWGDVVDNATFYYQSSEERGATYLSSMSTSVTNMDAYMAEIHADAQPVTRSYSVSLNTSGGSATAAHAQRVVVGSP